MEDGTNRQFEMYDNLSEFIEHFEEVQRNKKKKAVNKKIGLELFIQE